jgi:3-hydroxypropanoate dehydrogenase
MSSALPESALAQLFTQARTHNVWLDKPVDDATLHQLHELTKWGATSANCSPARFIFVKTPEGKERLKPCLSAGNADKTMTAPVCVIIAYDLEFYEQLPRLFPHTDARSWFAGKEKAILDTAFRNSSLQGAYLMLAARSLGLDCGPMSGFNAEKIKAAFFADKPWTANFICNLGYGDASALFPRSPRFDFDDVCSIV